MPIKPARDTLVTKHVLAVELDGLLHILLTNRALSVLELRLGDQTSVVLVPEEEPHHRPQLGQLGEDLEEFDDDVDGTEEEPHDETLVVFQEEGDPEGEGEEEAVEVGEVLQEHVPLPPGLVGHHAPPLDDADTLGEHDPEPDHKVRDPHGPKDVPDRVVQLGGHEVETSVELLAVKHVIHDVDVEGQEEHVSHDRRDVPSVTQ